MSFQYRAGSTVAIQQTKFNVFITSVRPFSSADCSASTPLAAGRLPSALRSKEEIGVRMPPALPLHTVRARIICGFRLVSETGSGSSSSDLTSASGASQWGNSSRSHWLKRWCASCSSAPEISNWQLSPASVSVPISARALLALPLRSVRRLCHSICDEKYYTAFQRGLPDAHVRR